MTPTPSPLDIACQHAHAFRRSLARRRPCPEIAANALEARFAGPTPETGQEAASVIDALALAAGPGLMAAPGPRFFGWVIGASHEAGVAADWLASVWGQNAAMYASSPAAAMAEKVAAGWLLDILRLPKECSVGFTTGATMASFTCLAAARSEVLRRTGWDVERKGLQGAPKVRVVLGADAHTTIFAALRLLGLGSDTPLIVATDDQGRMIPAELEKTLAAGNGPAIVIIQAGQINTGAFDPAREISDICRRHGAWLHVDGAFGLWARTVPEFSNMVEGYEQADSWATDGHKWLQVPYDCGFAIVRDTAAHRRAMTIGASYLPESAYDPSNYAPELSRRARGFACWAMIRTLGRDGISGMVRQHCAMAKNLSDRLSSVDGIEVLNEVCLNQVIVRFGGDDDLTRAVIQKLQADNLVFAEGARWRAKWILRIPVISSALTERDIQRLANAIFSAWRSVRSGLPKSAQQPACMQGE